jgi:hypothetical protein
LGRKKPINFRSLARGKVDGLERLRRDAEETLLLSYLPEKINHGESKEVMTYRPEL